MAFIGNGDELPQNYSEIILTNEKGIYYQRPFYTKFSPGIFIGNIKKTLRCKKV